MHLKLQEALQRKKEFFAEYLQALPYGLRLIMQKEMMQKESALS